MDLLLGQKLRFLTVQSGLSTSWDRRKRLLFPGVISTVMEWDVLGLVDQELIPVARTSATLLLGQTSYMSYPGAGAGVGRKGSQRKMGCYH